MSDPSMAVAKPVYSKRLPGTLAKVACAGCRRLKMKCITISDDLPCLRCAKADRPCVLPLTQKASQPASTGPAPPVKPLEELATSDVSADERPWPVNIQDRRRDRRRSVARSVTIPSLTPTTSKFSPLTLSPAVSYPWPSPSSSCPNSGRSGAPLGLRTEFGMPLTHAGVNNENLNTSTRQTDGEESLNLIDQEELRHLICFFIKNLLSQVMIIAKQDVTDVGRIINHNRPLALSMAYVAAHFVPGCKAHRTRLLPAVVSLAALRTSSVPDDNTDHQRWTTLQALAVLYTWAPSQVLEDAENSRIELTRDMLRLSIESLAARYSMHKSAQEVAELSKHTSSEEVRRTFAFRKYTYWLWLYTEAHFRSLVSRTPPTMREDASIIHAADILENMLAEDDAHIHNIVARVELCLLWERADLRNRDCGDWSCSTPNRLGAETLKAILNEMDDNMQSWHQQWCAPQRQGGILAESLLDLYQHFVYFCNAIYVAQAFRVSQSADEVPSAVASFQKQAFERALSLCNAFCKLNPTVKSLIRYGPERFFAMVAFSCEFIIDLRSTLDDQADSVWSDCTSVVSDVAELMIEMGPDNLHSSRVIGQRVLTRYLAANPVPTKRSSMPSAYKLAKSPNKSPRRSTPKRPSFHQRSCSADVLSLPYAFEMSSAVGSNGNSSSGSASVERSPEYQIILPSNKDMLKPWSAGVGPLYGMSRTGGIPDNDTEMSIDPAIMAVDDPDDEQVRMFDMSASAYWMQEQAISPPPAFF